MTISMLLEKRTILVLALFIAAALASITGGVIGASESQPGNTTNDSFSESKKTLHKFIYNDAEHRTDIYCGCKYNKKREVDFQACGYKPQKDKKRAHRIEWEHVVPAEAFGQSFKEWREGHSDCVDNKGKTFKGRKCTEKVNLEFRYMQADMYNLYPAVGEVNELRSNYSMAMISGKHYRFGKCKTKIEDKKVEPRPEVKGEIARTYFYMEHAYPGHGILSSSKIKMFEAWDKADPVDSWECERARRIAKIQGNVNKVVEDACKAAGL